VGFHFKMLSTDLVIEAQQAVDELLKERKIPLQLNVQTVTAPPDLPNHVSVRFSNGRVVTVLLKAGKPFKKRVKDAVLLRLSPGG
jgi:hypothetical protein